MRSSFSDDDDDVPTRVENRTDRVVQAVEGGRKAAGTAPASKVSGKIMSSPSFPLCDPLLNVQAKADQGVNPAAVRPPSLRAPELHMDPVNDRVRRRIRARGELIT